MDTQRNSERKSPPLQGGDCGFLFSAILKLL